MTTYIIHTVDMAEMDKPIGSSPVTTDYKEACLIAKKLRRAARARGDDWLMVEVVRRDEHGERRVSLL